MTHDAPAAVTPAEPEKATEADPAPQAEAVKPSEPAADGTGAGATKDAPAAVKAKEDLSDEDIKHLPIRQYLEHTVVGVILQGLQQVCRKRPEDPVAFMSEFMLRNNPRKRKAEEEAAEAAEAAAEIEQKKEEIEKPVVAPAAAPVE